MERTVPKTLLMTTVKPAITSKMPVARLIPFLLRLWASCVMFFNYTTINKWERKAASERDQARTAAMTDPMTGVKSKHAYLQTEKSLDEKLSQGKLADFAIVVCDVNDLKYVNDRFGHDFGDEYIRKACHMICQAFKMSPVFRTGGDEFVVILEGNDYEHREVLVKELQEVSMKNALTEDGIVIAVGMSIHKGNDAFHDVFHRADRRMYSHKVSLKKKRPSRVLR